MMTYWGGGGLGLLQSLFSGGDGGIMNCPDLPVNDLTQQLKQIFLKTKR